MQGGHLSVNDPGPRPTMERRGRRFPAQSSPSQPGSRLEVTGGGGGWVRDGCCVCSPESCSAEGALAVDASTEAGARLS